MKTTKPTKAMPAPAEVATDVATIKQALSILPVKLVVSDDKQYELGRVSYQTVRLLEKEIKIKEDSILDPLKLAMSRTKAIFKPFKDNLNQLADDYAAALGAYANKKEIERIKQLQQIEGDKRLKNVETIQAKKEAVEDRAAGTMTVTKLVIENEALIPDQYWIVDERAVKGALVNGITVPGAKLVKELVVTSR